MRIVNDHSMKAARNRLRHASGTSGLLLPHLRLLLSHLWLRRDVAIEVESALRLRAAHRRWRRTSNRLRCACAAATSAAAIALTYVPRVVCRKTITPCGATT